MKDQLTVEPRAGEAKTPPEPQVRIYVPSAPKDRFFKRLARRAAAWAGVFLAGYWMIAFAATHVPIKNEGDGGFLAVPHADKLVHLSLYAGLALLLCVWFGVRRHVSRAFVIAAAVSCLLAGYAAFDEISQGPVGRDPDLRDWFADLAGINFGLFGFFALRKLVRR